MPQSFSSILVHIVFATKNRFPLLLNDIREALHAHISGITASCGAQMVQVNSMPDHVHVLVYLPRTVDVSDYVKQIKGSSSRWLNENRASGGRFSWQSGYGAFSVSNHMKERVVNYIKNQQEHHRHRSFADEYKEFLRNHGITELEKFV